MKRWVFLLLGILILGVMAVLLGWEEIVQVARMMTPSQILAMTILQLFTLMMTAYIWYLLIKQKNAFVKLFDVFCVNLAGKFVESVTPSAKVGGEALKVYLMKRETDLSYTQLTAIAVASKFFSLLPFLMISAVTAAAAFFLIDLPLFVYLAFAGLLIFMGVVALYINRPGAFLPGVLAVKLERFREFILEASENARELVYRPHQRAVIFILAFVVWLFYPVKVFLVAAMLGFDIHPVVIVIATYAAYLVSMMPLLPGGLATFEGSMALVFAAGGVSGQEGFTIALMTRLITFWIPLFLSATAALFLIKKDAQQAQEKVGVDR